MATAITKSIVPKYNFHHDRGNSSKTAIVCDLAVNAAYILVMVNLKTFTIR